MPSLYEGFSLPAIEAMCTGTALVATDGGALPEVTGTDGETVLQCRAGDADALAAAIRRGLDDPELRARVGAAGRQRVRRAVDWRRCAELTVDQYREVLAMPHNVDKLRRNGRTVDVLTIRFDRARPAARRPACSTSAPASAATPSSSPAAAARVVALDYAADEVVGTRATRSRRWSRPARSPTSATSACCAATPRGCRSPTAPSTASSRARCSSTSRTTSPRSPRWCACCKPGGDVRGHGADVVAREDQLDAVATSTTRRRASAGTCASTRATELKAKLRAAGLRRHRQPPRPRPALAVLVAEVRRRACNDDDHPLGRAATSGSSSGTSSSSRARTRIADACCRRCSARASCVYATQAWPTSRRETVAHDRAARPPRRAHAPTRSPSRRVTIAVAAARRPG